MKIKKKCINFITKSYIAHEITLARTLIRKLLSKFKKSKYIIKCIFAIRCKVVLAKGIVVYVEAIIRVAECREMKIKW